MAATTYYCTQQDVIDRLTAAGVLRAADPTGRGTVADAAVLAQIDHGRVEAGRQIDRALQATWRAGLPLAQDDGALNEHLRGWATTIASYWVASVGFKGVPQLLKDQYKEARDDLATVKTKAQRIPGLAYPGDQYLPLRYGMGRPRVGNPGQPMYPGSMGDIPYRRRRGWGW